MKSLLALAPLLLALAAQATDGPYDEAADARQEIARA